MTFDLEKSRRYWRLVPSGQGKHDTTTLLELDDAQLEAAWDGAFHSRFDVYPEEDAFARAMAKRVAGRALLSIGSGLGFHEILYGAHGARVTCADIVQSNLDLITRVAARKRSSVTTLPARADVAYPGGQDIVLLYGCLMHMPPPAQRELLARAVSAVAPDGRLVLMLYTWTFAARTCGWEHPDQFDAAVFARASDPTVGEEACPWSDWHDDEKLLDLVGPGFRIARRQMWNDGLFVWYELERGTPRRSIEPFFPADAPAAGRTVRTLRASAFVPQDATVHRWFGRLNVTTSRNQFAYALSSPVIESAEFVETPSAFAFDLDVRAGRISAGVLDVDRGQFVSTQTASAGAPALVVPCPAVPRRLQLIVSNHAEGQAAVSEFAFRSARAVVRPRLEVPVPA